MSASIEDLLLKVEQLTEKVSTQDAHLAELRRAATRAKEEQGGAEEEEGLRELGAHSGTYVILNDPLPVPKFNKNGRMGYPTWRGLLLSRLLHLGCREAVEPSDDPILVGSGDVLMSDLRARHPERKLAEAVRAWGVLLEAVDDDGLLRKMVAAGSPSGAWDAIEQWHAPKSVYFRELWYGRFRAIRMEQGEEPQEYLGRIDDAVAMLALLETPVPDADVNCHILSHLSSDYDIEKRLFLYAESLSRSAIDRIIRDRHYELTKGSGSSSGSWGKGQHAPLSEDGSGHADQEKEEVQESSRGRGEGQRRLGRTPRNENRRDGGRDQEDILSGSSNGDWRQAQGFGNEGGGGSGSGSRHEDGNGRSRSRGRDRRRNKRGGSRGGPGRDAPFAGEGGDGTLFWPQQQQQQQQEFYPSQLPRSVQGSTPVTRPSSHPCPPWCYRCDRIGHVPAQCTAMATLAHGAIHAPPTAACAQQGQGNINSSSNSSNNSNRNINNNSYSFNNDININMSSNNNNNSTTTTNTNTNPNNNKYNNNNDAVVVAPSPRSLVLPPSPIFPPTPTAQWHAALPLSPSSTAAVSSCNPPPKGRHRQQQEQQQQPVIMAPVALMVPSAKTSPSGHTGVEGGFWGGVVCSPVEVTTASSARVYGGRIAPTSENDWIVL